MPSITIVNDTEVPLHIALRHISPVYYENNVAPGGRAVFKHVGRVWFTIEARIARSAQQPQRQGGVSSAGGEPKIEEVSASTETSSGAAVGAPSDAATASEQQTPTSKEKRAEAAANNEYTLFQQVAAPVAVSVAALSLGAGAIYVGMAASAAGSISAALSTISAQVTTAAASQAPTARRLYTLAKKGQSVVQVGQVLGIGGGAWLGTRAAANAAEGGQAVAAAEPADGPSDKERLAQVKKVLMELMEHAAVKSHGWYMGKDRVIRIRGGPRAAEVEKWLVIETDTVTPFEVLSDDPNDAKPDPAAQEKAMQEELAKQGGAAEAAATTTATK